MHYRSTNLELAAIHERFVMFNNMVRLDWQSSAWLGCKRWCVVTIARLHL